MSARPWVSGLAITPVKGTRLQEVQRIEVGDRGVRENRRFYLIDERNRMVNAKPLGQLQSIVSRYEDSERRLELEFPDGQTLSGQIELGPDVQTRFFSRQAPARLVLGEWSQAISAHVGASLRLVEAGEQGAVDRGAQGTVSLISRASLGRLAAEGGIEFLDPRRFRMLIEIDGVDAHAEDAWVGREVSVGAVRCRPAGHVGRCLITGRDPETGQADLPTLDLLRAYRSDADTTDALPFGIYGTVLAGGTISVGDRVTPPAE